MHRGIVNHLIQNLPKNSPLNFQKIRILMHLQTILSVLEIPIFTVNPTPLSIIDNHLLDHIGLLCSFFLETLEIGGRRVRNKGLFVFDNGYRVHSAVAEKEIGQDAEVDIAGGFVM